MKQQMIRLALLFLLLLLSSACRQDGEGQPEASPAPQGTAVSDDAPTDEQAASQEATATPAATATPQPSPTPSDPLASLDPSGQSVTLLHGYDSARAEALTELIDDFNDSNEFGITVEDEPFDSAEALQERLEEGTSEGAILLLADTSWLEVAQGEGTLSPLTPFLESSTWGLDEQARAGLALGEAGDEPQAVPLYHTLDLLYVNDDLLDELGFDAPPDTWEAFEEMACAASEAGNVGFALDALNMEGSPSHFASLLWSVDSEWLEDGTFTLNTPEAVELLGTLQGLYEQGCILTTAGNDASLAAFGAGTLLFALDSSARLAAYGAAVEGGYAGAWSVAPLPHDGAEPAVAMRTVAGAIPQGEEAEVLAAWLLLRWLAAPEQQAEWAQATGDLPAQAAALAELDGLLSELPAFERALELLPFARTEPYYAGYATTRSVIEEALAQIIEGADAEETLLDLDDEVNALLEADE